MSEHCPDVTISGCPKKMSKDHPCLGHFHSLGWATFWATKKKRGIHLCGDFISVGSHLGGFYSGPVSETFSAQNLWCSTRHGTLGLLYERLSCMSNIGMVNVVVVRSPPVVNVALPSPPNNTPQVITHWVRLQQKKYYTPATFNLRPKSVVENQNLQQ